MTPSKSLEILGLAADASRQDVRQAYLDLVRVWHPDRFQSDSRLQKIAQDRLREINDAYESLKKVRLPLACDPPPDEASFAEPRPPSPFPEAYRPARRKANWRIAGYMIGSACVFGAILVGGMGLVTSLDAPAAPDMSSTLRRIDPMGEMQQAARSLASVPRRAASLIAPKPSLPDTAAIPNGAELMPPRSAKGAGELRLANNTDLEGILSIADGETLIRAVYVAPHQRVNVRSIAIGVYDVHVELGTDLDAARLRFRANRFAPQPLGRLEFVEFTSEKGTSGSHYDLAVNPRR